MFFSSTLRGTQGVSIVNRLENDIWKLLAHPTRRIELKVWKTAIFISTRFNFDRNNIFFYKFNDEFGSILWVAKKF